MASVSQVGKRTFWENRAELNKEGGGKKEGLRLSVGAKPHLFSRHGTINSSCQSINTQRMTERECSRSWVYAEHGTTCSVPVREGGAGVQEVPGGREAGRSGLRTTRWWRHMSCKPGTQEVLNRRVWGVMVGASRHVNERASRGRASTAQATAEGRGVWEVGQACSGLRELCVQSRRGPRDGDARAYERA